MTFNFYETEVGKQQAPVDVNAEYYPHELTPKKYPKGSKVLVTDSDILCFKLASVGDDRVCLVSKNGKTKEFKNRTEFKKLHKNKGWDFSEFTFEDILKPKPIEHCLGNLKNAIKNIKQRTGCTHIELYIGGSGNFRVDLPLPTKYKSARKDSLRPTYLKECKDYMIKYHKALKIKGVECDDYVQQRMWELYQDDMEAMLYTNDKDALQSIKHPITTYNPDKDEIKTFKHGLGELWIQSEKYVKGSGLKWLILQTLVGDSSDGYKGNDLADVDFGEKTYYKDVSNIENEKDLLTFAVNKWKEWYPSPVTYKAWDGKEYTKNWLEIAEMYWSCAYMRIGSDDQTTFESLLKEWCVEY